MNKISLGIFIILCLISLTLTQTPQQCKECAANPCGCQLFKCSTKLQFPTSTQDLSKGFSGCQQTNGDLVANDIIQQLQGQGSCLCPYMKIDESCKPIDQSGIMLGAGFELTGESADNLKKLDGNLLKKLSPYFAKQEAPLQYLMANSIELTQQELQDFEKVKAENEIQNLQKQYDASQFNRNQYGKLNKDRPKFAELSRGVRTVIYSQNKQYGKPDNFLQLWNYALRTDFQNMLDYLSKQGQERGLLESQILKYCMEKCSESKKVNILFVIDGSGSINKTNFETQRDFIRNVIQGTNVGSDSYLIGLLLFSTQLTLVSDFSSDKAALINALNAMDHPKGYTYTNKALIEAKELFQLQAKKRPDALNIMFVLTDGNPFPSSQAITDQTIKDLKNLEVQRYAIGIGDIKEEVLIQISGDTNQDKSRMYFVQDFSKLYSLINSLSVSACSTPQEIKLNQKVFDTALDGQGSQYLKFPQKQISLTIDVKDQAVISSLFSSSYQLSLANTDQNNDQLDDVEAYYSFTYDMPNQFINDGAGEQKDGVITLVINNDKTSTTYVSLKKKSSGKINLSVEQESLQLEKCDENCTLCNSQLICKLCDEGYELVQSKCQVIKLAEPIKVEKKLETVESNEPVESENSKVWLIVLVTVLVLVVLGVGLFIYKKKKNSNGSNDLAYNNQTHQTLLQN
ncbi:UNKNOWN [Stylonychia lemnae]|uniref:VWFA domain-containing protein n=1 Tax=Stylonychia lemnae TaxID=5949 RepID=A0A078B1N9_STYLE|nr:UNKNOWN [Stylonychia lemnae]|eukprot:CDW88480.1 UNKNOWN [Stylonychia lemnae]